MIFTLCSLRVDDCFLCRCLQHPYLYAEDLEPPKLSPQDAHEKLIDASAKLRFLKMLLPKLKEGGHRVLLFSQVSTLSFVVHTFLSYTRLHDFSLSLL